MDIEYAVLSKTVEDQGVAYLVDRHITAEFFDSDRNSKVYEMIMDHWRNYGTVPEEDAIQAAYPWFHVDTTLNDPLNYYIDMLRDRRLFRIGMAGVTEAVQNSETGPNPGQRLVEDLRQTLSQAISEVPAGKDVDYFTGFETGTLPRLMERKLSPGHLRGLPTGFDAIDRVTGGLQPQQLITLVGTPKSGKSTMMLTIARSVRIYGGVPVLFFTFEMSAEEQEDRLVSIISGVDLNHILNGTFNRRELDAIKASHILTQELPGLTIVADTSSVTTLSEVQAKIRHYKPGAVFIDGIYLMDDEHGEPPMSSKALTNLTRGAKRIAQAELIPVVISTQALDYRSKKGVNLSSIGYSSSFAQDSDVVFAAEPVTDHIKKFSVIAQRSGPKLDTYVRIDWGQGMIAEIDEAEAEVEAMVAAQRSDTVAHTTLKVS